MENSGQLSHPLPSVSPFRFRYSLGPHSRIIAVADVVEAMANHRPYRPALGIDAALDEIESRRGELYDPAVVDACLLLFREKGFAFSQ